MSVFCTILGFVQSHSGSSNDRPQGFIQKIAGNYKSEKRNKITGIDKIQLIKFVVIMDLLVLVSENFFCVVLPQISLLVIKYN